MAMHGPVIHVICCNLWMYSALVVC